MHEELNVTGFQENKFEYQPILTQDVVPFSLVGNGAKFFNPPKYEDIFYQQQYLEDPNASYQFFYPLNDVGHESDSLYDDCTTQSTNSDERYPFLDFFESKEKF